MPYYALALKHYPERVTITDGYNQTDAVLKVFKNWVGDEESYPLRGRWQ